MKPLMKRAIEDLPGEVSLAFLPGTPDLLRWLRGRASTAMKAT